MGCYVKLSHLPRLFSFPYPAAAIAIYDDIVWMPDFQHKMVFKKPQITFRLKSGTPEMRHYVNRKKYVSHFPHVIVENPGAEYYAETDTVKRHSLSISYDDRAFSRLRRTSLFPDELACWDVDQSTSVTVIAAEIRELLSEYQEIGVADQLDLRCFQLLEEAALVHINAIKNKYRHTKMEQIRKYLQQNYWKDIRFDELFFRFGLSRSSFFRHWKQIYNISPLHYLWTLRLDESARLLVSTSLPVGLIGARLHFHSSAYFASSFKARFGVSPRVYRENHFLLHHLPVSGGK